MSVTIVMPVWNEAEGIEEFLSEIASEFRDMPHQFVVVDDSSGDETVSIVEALADSGLPVTLLVNSTNMGHGPSTLRALESGLESGADVVVSVDGDGQFIGKDIRRIADSVSAGDADIVEGVRTSRDDPYFRQAVSLGTRILVWLRCGRLPADANTPLRAYRSKALSSILGNIPNQASTPNLFVSAYVRKSGLAVMEMRVRSIPRRGAIATGSTWGKSRTYLPSKRFITFCVNAVREWTSTTQPSNSTK